MKSIFLTSSHWRAILLIRTVWTFRRSITSPRHVHARTVLTAEMIRTTRWWNCRKNKSILYTCSLGLSTKTSILVQPTKVQQTSFKVTLSQLRPFAHTKNFCSVFFLRILSYNPGQNSSGHLIQFCKNPNEQLKLDFTRVSPTSMLHIRNFNYNEKFRETPFEANLCGLSTTFWPGLSEKRWTSRSAL